jgi:hypothetical protein
MNSAPNSSGINSTPLMMAVSEKPFCSFKKV